MLNVYIFWPLKSLWILDFLLIIKLLTKIEFCWMFYFCCILNFRWIWNLHWMLIFVKCWNEVLFKKFHWVLLLLFIQFYNNWLAIMGVKFAVVGSNLVVLYKEIKLFALLPQLYLQDFINFLLRNYFRFLDDIFRISLENLT